jgi:hypothetical protein
MNARSGSARSSIALLVTRSMLRPMSYEQKPTQNPLRAMWSSAVNASAPFATTTSRASSHMIHRPPSRTIACPRSTHAR